MFGLGVWAASYLGWIPGLRILEPATQHPAHRTALMLMAHVIWGVSLASGLREIELAERFRHAGLRDLPKPGDDDKRPGALHD